MDLNVWLPPAVIIAVLGTFNTVTTLLTNRRIDDLRQQMSQIVGDLRQQMTQIVGDLRQQMSREHDTLAKKVDETNSRLGKMEQNHLDHITQFHIQPKSKEIKNET